MADETVMDGEFFDDRMVEISGNEASTKISGLITKIFDLERENAKTILENEGYNNQIEELKTSIEELSTEIVELKKQVEKAESESKSMAAVADRAAELEAEVSRLQHDLVSAMSDLQESSAELSKLKKDLEGVEEREKEQDAKLEAFGKERDLLLSKVEKLEGVESSLRNESKGKEKELRGLKKSIHELEMAVESGKSLEKLKNELEKEIEKMKVQFSILQSNLKEKKSMICELERKERAHGVLSGDDLIKGEKKIIIGGLKQNDWLLVGGSAVAAFVVVGVVSYLHARKH
ncbi:hypothetical protein OROGR_000307 [Orobanche gracilis]